MNLEKELKGALVRKINIPHEPNHKWPVEKKIEVVTKYLALGNLKLVAELTGVSYGLIRVWKTYDWWRDLEAEIKATRNIVVGSKLSKIVDKSLEMIGDRLEYGDLVWDKKTGDVNRAPLSVLTVNKIANDMMTRQIEINKLAVVETNSNQQQTVADQLKALAAEFARFNTGRTVDVVAKDVSDAIYEEREEGLSEGESVGSRPWPTEGPSGTEQSASNRGEEGSGPQGGWDGRGSQEANLEGGQDHTIESESGDSPQEPELPSYFAG